MGAAAAARSCSNSGAVSWVTEADGVPTTGTSPTGARAGGGGMTGEPSGRAAASTAHRQSAPVTPATWAEASC